MAMANLYLSAFLLLSFGFTALPVNALICYSCHQTIGEPFNTCQYDPEFVNTTTVQCNKKYCITKLIEHHEQKEGQLFISRSCEDSPPILNGSLVKDGVTTYYQACTTDLCNKGNGKMSQSERPDLTKTFTDRPCQINNRWGICRSSYQCYLDGGINIGYCGLRTGTCCSYEYSCGQSTSFGRAYFKSPNQPYPLCQFTVQVKDPKVTQVRLDFNRFSLAQPEGGTEMQQTAWFCQKDRFSIYLQSGGIGNTLGFDYLCGENSGQHIYVPVDASMGTSSFQIVMQTNNQWMPMWDIGITQINCASTYTAALCAPRGCLQYYPNSMGWFESFNFPGQKYLGRLNYAICFNRTNPYSCGIHFGANTFTLAQDDFSAPYGDSGCSTNPGTGTPSYDYIMIPDGRTDNNIYSTKFCGQFLSNTGVTTRVPGTPYLMFHSDENRDEVTNGPEVGFRFQYQEVSYGC